MQGGLEGTLKGPCKDFIDAVLKKLSASGGTTVDLVSLFKDISSQSLGGFYQVFEGRPYAIGDRNKGTAAVGLLDLNDIPTLIHELFHHESSGHTAMGTAAYAVLGDQGRVGMLKNTNTPGPPREEKTLADNYYNSGIFDNAVQLICGSQAKTSGGKP